MARVLCFISNDMADFEVVLTLHRLKQIGRYDIVTVSYDTEPVVSESGVTYLPTHTLSEAMAWPDVKALIIPGGAIRPQGEDLTDLIRKLHREKALLAAICFGPQYLGRAGVLDDVRFTTSCSREKIAALGVPDPYPRHNSVEERVVRDGHVITAKGHAFVDFAFAVFDYLGIDEGREAEEAGHYRDIVGRELTPAF